MTVAPLDYVAPVFNTSNHVQAMVNTHNTFIVGESIPVVGVVASVGRALFSALELVGGTIGYTLSGGCCCIPCPLDKPCTSILAEWQRAGRVHMALGAFGLLDSIVNIGTGSSYQCLSSTCSGEGWAATGAARVRAIANAADGATPDST